MALRRLPKFQRCVQFRIVKALNDEGLCLSEVIRIVNREQFDRFPVNKLPAIKCLKKTLTTQQNLIVMSDFFYYSLFWWTNETLNAWTHLLGWIYFAYFTVEEILLLVNGDGTSAWQDSAINLLITICFQVRSLVLNSAAIKKI